MSWFSSSFFILVASFALVTIFLRYRFIANMAFFPNSNVMLVWIVFLFYSNSAVTFCFLISAVFKKASIAGNVGTIIFIATFVFYYQFRDDFLEMHYVVKMLYCLPLNTGLAQVIAMVLELDLSSEGLQFPNMSKRVNGFGFSVIESILMFCLASFIHLMLMIYIEQVFTGSIGVAKPWYFPISPIIKMFKGKNNNSDGSQKEKSKVSNEDFEQEPSGMKAGIKIVNLSKTFGKDTAVNQLNLNIYEDQITVLLGHNGKVFSDSHELSSTTYIN